jgi:glutamate-ammonia-ligase adenylyltransferase
MAATANPLGSKNNDMRLPMLGSEEPRAPLTNIAAKTLTDLISSAPEECSTRFNATTTDLLPSNPSDRSTGRCIHGKPDWNVIQSWRVDLTAHWLESVPKGLHETVQRFAERARDQGGLVAGFESLGEERSHELARVVAASEFAASALLQDPDALAWLEQPESDVRAAGAEYERRAASAASLVDAERVLRMWRRREMLRIAWRDITARAPVEETLRAVSDLADACIRAAVQAARTHLRAIFGTPRCGGGVEADFIVLGMGKLGGRELNFSSDIDLIFLFAEGGETDGAHVVANEEYFNRLGRELIRLLDARTDEGFVFRVDMRLRPFGESGPLVVSLAALDDYLQQHGRDWERYAWIKARAIVGADAYAAAYAEFVRPFVYRRYLDFGVFESLRDMKALIAREVARRELEQDLKLGRGGIREIEFIVQSMQLVRGGSDRRLQRASLLEVLPLLVGSKLMSAEEVAQLAEAYLLLRKAENALQMMRDQQVHCLPIDAQDRMRLCIALDVAEWPEALARIERAREVVANRFDSWLFAAADSSADREVGLGWLDSPGDDVAEDLAEGGFPHAEIAAVAPLLDAYRQAAPYRRLDDTGRRRVRIIVARLLKTAALKASPACMIERVLRVLDAIGARSSYLALLKEQPAALDRLIDVCAVSGFLARQIADFPLLLDELIDAKAFDELPSRARFSRELAARTERLRPDDPEREVEALRVFQRVATFSVALADLTQRLPLMQVSDRLTDIAELIVECCMDLAWTQMTTMHGVPRCGENEGTARIVKVAAAGYGKLGGLELGYGSDLDLVFLHDSAGEFQQTTRGVDNGVFFLRLGQRIVHLLTMHSAAGRLYEVDMRLRPNGKGGFLMTGIEAFELYQHQNAWTWEHQALLRARAVAGDADLCAQFEAARRRVLCTAVHRDTLRADVAEMRQRMRRELSESRTGQFDIKQDAGGIADIEFLVQYWVLQGAAGHPELVKYSDNVRQLDGLAAAGLVADATARWLKETYIGYRTLLHHLSLEGRQRVVEAAEHAQRRARVQEIWRETFG